MEFKLQIFEVVLVGNPPKVVTQPVKERYVVQARDYKEAKRRVRRMFIGDHKIRTINLTPDNAIHVVIDNRVPDSKDLVGNMRTKVPGRIIR